MQPAQNVDVKTYLFLMASGSYHILFVCIIQTVKTLGYSSELRKFLREAGADPDTFTKEGQSKV